jgi:hypothetical protein
MKDFDFTYGLGNIGFSNKRLTTIGFLNEKDEPVTLSIGDIIECPDFIPGTQVQGLSKIGPTQCKIKSIDWDQTVEPSFIVTEINTGETVVVFANSIIRKIK